MEEKQEAHQQAFPAWYSLGRITQLGALSQQLPFPSLRVPSTTSLLDTEVKNEVTKLFSSHPKTETLQKNFTIIKHDSYSSPVCKLLYFLLLEFKISFIYILKTLLIPFFLLKIANFCSKPKQRNINTTSYSYKK